MGHIQPLQCSIKQNLFKEAHTIIRIATTIGLGVFTLSIRNSAVSLSYNSGFSHDVPERHHASSRVRSSSPR